MIYLQLYVVSLICFLPLSNSTFSGSFSFTGNFIEFPLFNASNVQINWGDGTAVSTVSGTNFTSHTYSSDGTYTISLNGTRDYSNYDPTALLLEIDTSLGTTTFSLALTCSQVAVDWGDGNSDSTASHVYSTGGIYTIAITGSCSTLQIGEPSLTNVPSFGNLGITDWSYAFNYCDNLLTVSPLMKAATSFYSMFLSATSFNSDISNWDTSQVIDMSGMFNGASSFNQDLNDWDTSQVTDMSYMFYSASSFNGNIGNWNTSLVTGMKGMFYSASVFNQDLNDWDTSQVTDMTIMFNSAFNFNGNISNWDISQVTDMYGMFSYASVFNQALNNWDTSQVTDMSYMFYYASYFNGEISNWNTSQVTDMVAMFYYTFYFNQDLNNWDTSQVTDMSYMFNEAFSFNQDLNNWDTSQVTDMSYMFNEAFSFNQDLNNWDTSQVTDMSYMFNDASNFNGNIGNWNTSLVTNMDAMFYSATSFNQNLNNWDTSQVTDMSYMFNSASYFNGEISNWNTYEVTDTSYMFEDATAFNQTLDCWQLCSVTSTTGMFEGASNYYGGIPGCNTTSQCPKTTIAVTSTLSDVISTTSLIASTSYYTSITTSHAEIASQSIGSASISTLLEQELSIPVGGKSVNSAGANTNSNLSASSAVFPLKTILAASVAGCILIVLCGASLLYGRNKRKKSIADDKRLSVVDSETPTGMERSQWSEVTSNGFGTETNSTLMNTNIGLAIPVFTKFNNNSIIRPIKKIASGGFGTVSLCESIDPSFKQDNGDLVILKEFNHVLKARERDMFYQEISIMNALKSYSNIVKFIGYSDEPFSIVMKYYSLGSLENWILCLNEIKTKRVLMSFLIDISIGIKVMHERGIAHCDLKPANVLLDTDLKTRKLFCVLTDFGISQVFNDTSLLIQEYMVINVNGASITYAAPEALLRMKARTNTSVGNVPMGDIYSYSIIITEMLTRTIAYGIKQ